MAKLKKFKKTFTYTVSWEEVVVAPNVKVADQMFEQVLEDTAGDFGGATGEFDESPAEEVETSEAVHMDYADFLERKRGSGARL